MGYVPLALVALHKVLGGLSIKNLLLDMAQIIARLPLLAFVTGLVVLVTMIVPI